MNFWGNAEAYADVQQPSAGFQSKHTCSVVLESTALRESTVVRTGFSYQQQHIKCSQCLDHRKMLTEEDL